MSQFAWGAVIWLSWFGLWVVLELLGYWHVTPWTTLSDFVWQAEGYAGILRWVFLVGLAILLTHLCARWP